MGTVRPPRNSRARRGNTVYHKARRDAWRRAVSFILERARSGDQIKSPKRMSEEVFISYSTQDAAVAEEIKRRLESKGASVFVASTSVEPGTKWSSEILQKLRESKLVLFLASKKSCDSKYVNQEIGGTVIMQKPLVPVLCGVSTAELPGWSKEFQAVPFARDRVEIDNRLDRIAATLRSVRFWRSILFIGAICLLIYLARKK